MRRNVLVPLTVLATTVLAGCGNGGILNRERPDEFAVQRQAPLVIPPDYTLTPPVAGTVRMPVAAQERQYSNLGLRGFWHSFILTGDAARSDNGGTLGLALSILI